MPHCDEEPDTNELWDLNLEFFSRLIPEAKREGVTICFENMPMKNLSISTFESCNKFLDMLNSEKMGNWLDTGHAWGFGTEPADAVRMLGNRIKAFHIHDNNGDYDRHLLPTWGTINWEEFKKAIKECVDESVPLSLETEPEWKIPTEVREEFEIATASLARYIAN